MNRQANSLVMNESLSEEVTYPPLIGFFELLVIIML